MSKVTISAALAKVNEAREAIGYEPLDKMPKGIVSLPTDCPVHNAFGEFDTHVTGEYISVYSRDMARKIASAWGTRVLDTKTYNSRFDKALLDVHLENDQVDKKKFPVQDYLYGHRWCVVCPKEIVDFIDAFDSEQFPSLAIPRF